MFGRKGKSREERVRQKAYTRAALRLFQPTRRQRKLNKLMAKHEAQLHLCCGRITGRVRQEAVASQGRTNNPEEE